MNAQDIAESLVWALPFLALAGVFFAIAAWKRSKGRGLHAQAQELMSSGRHVAARDLLAQALWKANEEPRLERLILADLGKLYGEAGVPFSADDYHVLIGQFEQLSKKGSHKAISEMKEVQALKQELIGKMPAIA